MRKIILNKEDLVKYYITKDNRVLELFINDYKTAKLVYTDTGKNFVEWKYESTIIDYDKFLDLVISNLNFIITDEDLVPYGYTHPKISIDKQIENAINLLKEHGYKIFKEV